MNLLLTLDLSGDRGTLSLHRAGSLLLELEVGDKFDHAEKWIPTLEMALKQTGVSLENLSAVLTSSGPGSFTGMRVAYSALKALAIAHGIPFFTMNGNEARLLAWGKPVGQILSYFSQSQVVVSMNAVEKIYTLNKVPIVSGVTLIEERIRKERLPVGNEYLEFPLRARHLAEALDRSKTLVKFATREELILASPQYYGEFREPVIPA